MNANDSGNLTAIICRCGYLRFNTPKSNFFIKWLINGINSGYPIEQRWKFCCYKCAWCKYCVKSDVNFSFCESERKDRATTVQNYLPFAIKNNHQILIVFLFLIFQHELEIFLNEPFDWQRSKEYDIFYCIFIQWIFAFRRISNLINLRVIAVQLYRWVLVKKYVR